MGIVAGCYDEAEQAESGGDEDRDEWATGAVDVAEGLGRLALLGEGGEGAAAGVDGGVADGEDGDEDDGVHDAGQTADGRITDGDDEGRGISVGAAGSEEARVVVGNQETGDCERDHVEEQDAPEDLLDGFGELDARVPGLGCCETDKFGAGEGEGGGDEDAAQALETVVEGTGFVPCASA